MKIKTFLIVFIIVIFLLFNIIFHTVRYYGYDEFQKYEFDFKVVEKNIGFNIDKDRIHFGNIPQGNGAMRSIFITNFKNVNRTIVFSATNLNETIDYTHLFWINTSYKYVLLPNETKEFQLNLKIDENMQLGFYEGYINFKVRNQLPWEKNIYLAKEPVWQFQKDNFWEIIRHDKKRSCKVE